MISKKMVLGGFVGLVSIVLGASAFAAANPGTSGPTPVPTVIGPGPALNYVSPCADGWHLVPGSQSGDQFSCIPTKTTQMIECPVGLDYYDNGCDIGCAYVPK